MQDSSGVATFGSRPLSAVNKSLGNKTCRTCLSEESEVDCLVTKVLVLGGFSSAISSACPQNGMLMSSCSL